MSEINWHDETTRRFITSRVARPEPGDTARRCFYVDDHHRDEGGVIPMLVREDQSGYVSMEGPNPPESTWYWGATPEEARGIAELVNRELFGISPEEANAIVGASMALQDDEDDEDDADEEPDVVWVRATAEVSLAGVDPTESYIAIPRAEWDAMTPEQQEELLVDQAVQVLAEVASSGASVVDASQVPAADRADALAQL